MALEGGVTYIEDLVSTNPVGATDNVDEGDDHIRNIKTAVQGSFPNLGAVAVTKTAAQINSSQGQVVPATTNNLAMLDASGDLADSLVESDGSGNLTANVIGNLTGNVTGNVSGSSATITGNLGGDVSSVGMTTTLGKVVTGSKMVNASSGTGYIVNHNDDVTATTSAVLLKVKETSVPYGGDFNVYWEYKSSSGAQTASSQIWVNGANVGALDATTSTFYVPVSENIASISPGDLIQIYVKVTGGATVSLQNFRIRQDVPANHFGNSLE